MAKAIKFNLVCDNNPIRTIEDLQNNFSIEDMLSYYDNKLLHRWLNVRGYETELEKINTITSTDSLIIIQELIKIFNVEVDSDKISEGIYILKYLNEQKELTNIYKDNNYNVNLILDDYEQGYNQLTHILIDYANTDNAITIKDDLDTPITTSSITIKDKSNKLAKVKAAINEISNKYQWIFQLDHRNLFYTLKSESPISILCLLMNESFRKYFLPIKLKDEYDEIYFDTAKNKDKKIMYQSLCSLLNSNDFINSLGDNLKKFSGETDGYWKDLEAKGKKYLILSIGSGDYIRSAGEAGGDLSYNDVHEQFLIVDGIDYKSNNSYNKLLYMEV